MGTSCIFRVIDKVEDKIVTRVYSQYDGYPSGLPQKIFRWMSKGEVGNGISYKLTKDDVFFNGAGDLAVQLIIQCKMHQCSEITEPGGIYLVTGDSYCMYRYDIFVQEGKEPYVITYDGNDNELDDSFVSEFRPDKNW